MAVESAAGDKLEGAQDRQSVELFEQSWRIYTKIADLDFLAHRELFAALQGLMRSLPGPFSMLDLGCGDCARVAAALREAGLELSAFTGIDAAAPALAAARQQLAAALPPMCRVTLLQADMLEYLEGAIEEQYDLVLAAFAVHHLSLEAKAELVAAVRQCLRPGGTFALIDVFKADGESRAEYMRRLRAHVDAKLTEDRCSAAEREVFWDHMHTHDYPEELETYRLIAQRAGFAGAECIHTDPANFFRLVVLRT